MTPSFQQHSGIVLVQEGYTLPLNSSRKTEDGKRGKLTVRVSNKRPLRTDFQMPPFLLPARFHRHVEASQPVKAQIPLIGLKE